MSDESLGGYLRKEREARGFSLEQVASATKVGIRQLHCLENDQFDELPAKPFTRGFVTSYCRFVGIDSKEVLVRFSKFIDEKSEERPDRSSGHSGYAFERREGDQSRTVLWIVLGLFVVGGGVLFVIFKPTFKHRKHGQIEKLKSASAVVARPSPGPSPVVVPSVAAPTLGVIPAVAVAVSVPSPLPASQPEVVPSPGILPTPRPDPLNSGAGLTASEVKYKTVFMIHEDVWIRFKVDDRPAMRIVVRKDKVLVLKAKTAIRIQVSNAQAVSFGRSGASTKKVADSADLQMIQDTATLFFPPELKNSVSDPFPGAGPLPVQVPVSPKRPSVPESE